MSIESIKILRNAACWLIVLMAFTVLSINASAATYQPIEQCWQRPTERENGAVLALEEIIEYQIWYNERNHGLDWELAWTVPNTVGCVTYTPQGSGGEVCFNGFTVAVNNVDPALAPLKSQVSGMRCYMPVEIIEQPSPPKPPSMIDQAIAALVDWLKGLI